MTKNDTQLNKALTMILDGFRDSLSNPEVVETVIKEMAAKVQSEGCCPLHLSDISDLQSCPLTVLSLECYRRQGAVSEDVTEENLGLLRLFNNPYLQGFMKISRTVTSTLDYTKVLGAVVKEVAAVFEAKGCTLLLLNKDKTQLEGVAAYGLSRKYLEKGPVDAQRSMAETMAGEPQQIYDVQNDPRVQYPVEAAEEGIGSILAVPIKIFDRVIGNLRIFTEQKRKFHMYEVEYAMAVAEQCGIAIENALMYSKGQEKYKSLLSEVHNWMEYCTYVPE
jgi:transcriptional regulator with GAF, ATPase, and Fis domain